MRFRRARGDEAELLGEMMLAGVRHWGHHESFPEAYAGLAAIVPGEAEVETTPTFVLEDGGEVIGFYSLRERDEHVELLQMFLAIDRIGTGLGRTLWDHAVSQAATISDRMQIRSDPMAQNFYVAMGAELEREVEVSPGFSLGILGYDLTR